MDKGFNMLMEKEGIVMEVWHNFVKNRFMRLEEERDEGKCDTLVKK